MPTKIAVKYQWLCDNCTKLFNDEIDCILHERNDHRTDEQHFEQLFGADRDDWEPLARKLSKYIDERRQRSLLDKRQMVVSSTSKQANGRTWAQSRRIVDHVGSDVKRPRLTSLHDSGTLDIGDGIGVVDELEEQFGEEEGDEDGELLAEGSKADNVEETNPIGPPTIKFSNLKAPAAKFSRYISAVILANVLVQRSPSRRRSLVGRWNAPTAASSFASRAICPVIGARPIAFCGE